MAKNYKITNNQKNILVIDSGNGGLYTLKILKKFLPNENFIFVQDERNCPYGNKSKNKLKKISKKLIDFLLNNYDIKLIILACNTLSSVALNYLKKCFSLVPIVPIFPVIKLFKTNTLILCTNATKKYCTALKKARKNPKVKICGFSHLAKKIDENIENLSVLQPFLNKKLKKYAKMNIRQVVLGCTHYNLIKQQIQKALQQNNCSQQQKKYIKITSKSCKNNYNLSNQNLRVFKLKIDKISFIEGSVDLAKKVDKILEVLSIKNHSKMQSNTIILNTNNPVFDACFN